MRAYVEPRERCHEERAVQVWEAHPDRGLHRGVEGQRRDGGALRLPCWVDEEEEEDEWNPIGY